MRTGPSAVSLVLAGNSKLRANYSQGGMLGVRCKSVTIRAAKSPPTNPSPLERQRARAHQIGKTKGTEAELQILRACLVGVEEGLVFKAHRLLYHSTLGLRVIKKTKKVEVGS